MPHRLVDVYPPSEDYPQGFAMNVTNGIQRARFGAVCTELPQQDGGSVGGSSGGGVAVSGTSEAPQYLVPGRQYMLTVQLGVSSNLFKKVRGCGEGCGELGRHRGGEGRGGGTGQRFGSDKARWNGQGDGRGQMGLDATKSRSAPLGWGYNYWSKSGVTTVV